MTPLTGNAYEELVQAELATAEASPSAESLRRVATAYQQGGLLEVALAVLRKAPSFGIEQDMILPVLLGHYRKQRQFALLNAMVQSAVAIRPRDASLRRELALAHSSLGQTQAADAEWSSLIRDGCMTESDWLSCARSIAASPDAAAFEQGMAALAGRPELRSCSGAAYCAAKHLVGRDMPAARDVLRDLDPAGLPDSDLQLDLAIVALRLRDYAKAAAAATLAAASTNDATGARRILATIRSFAGDVSSLRTLSLPIPAAAEVLVSAHTLTLQRDAAGWGYLYWHNPGSLKAQLLDLTAEPDMSIPEGVEPVATFSVLPEPLKADLFHILCGVDWSWPHFTLQRRLEGDALHCFVEAPGHKYWLWEEVNPQLQQDAEDPTGGSRCRASTTWVEASRELAEATDTETS